MLLVETSTGKVCGVGSFDANIPPGCHVVDGPYTKDGVVVTNVGQVEEEIKAREVEKVLGLRQAAYREESDPLYLEWQYDSTPESEQAWRDKVAEIKARYPLPEESQEAA